MHSSGDRACVVPRRHTRRISWHHLTVSRCGRFWAGVGVGDFSGWYNRKGGTHLFSVLLAFLPCCQGGRRQRCVGYKTLYSLYFYTCNFISSYLIQLYDFDYFTLGVLQFLEKHFLIVTLCHWQLRNPFRSRIFFLMKTVAAVGEMEVWLDVFLLDLVYILCKEVSDMCHIVPEKRNSQN